MKNIRIMAFVGAALVFMFAYFFLSSRVGTSVSSGPSASGQKKIFVIAKNDIAPNTVISGDMIETREILISEGDTDYFEKTEDVVGRIAIAEIYKDERISARRTVDKDSSYGLGNKIAKGKRAISIAVSSEKSLASNLRVGDHVDIILVQKFEQEDVASTDVTGLVSGGLILDRILGPGEPRNSTVFNNSMGLEFANTNMQNIKVLALDKLTYYSVDNNSIDYVAVTLEVSPEQARMIALTSTGRHTMYLTLRANGDDEQLDTLRDEAIKAGTTLEQAPLEGGEGAGGQQQQQQGQQPNAGQTTTSGSNQGAVIR